MGMLDLGRTDAAAVPLPEPNREFVFFDLQGRLARKSDDGSITLIVPGRDGVNGANGRDGLDGAQGAPGRDGLDGAPGLPGRDGLDGQNGLNGLKGENGLDGAPGLSGRDGVDGVPGAKGDKGDQGLPGANGVNAVIASRLVANSISSISIAGAVLSLGVLNLSAAEIAAGASVDLSVFGVSAVGTTNSGRMAIRVLVNGVLLTQALQTTAMGSGNTVQAFNVSGKLIVAAGRVDAVLTQVYGAQFAQQVVQANYSGGVVIEVQTVIVTAATGFAVSPRAASLRA